MADARHCDQCGTLFVPRREHGRFCSSRCRVAWNRGRTKIPPGQATALDWSIAAMVDTIDRLPRVKAWDAAQAVTVIGEAVWRVTMVDATMVRYQPDIYDQVLTSVPRPERRLIEESLAGLRFVRNHLGHDIDQIDFVQAGRPRQADARDQLATWTWRSLPPPSFAALSARAKEWELDRYRAYQLRLANQPVCQAFSRVRAFLLQAATAATPTGQGVPASS
jgi:predicted nucleic acid-binding Zn ribbon protein